MDFTGNSTNPSESNPAEEKIHKPKERAASMESTSTREEPSQATSEQSSEEKELAIPEELRPIMENPDIPEEAKIQITTAYMESSWRGPLPPPWVMQEYGEVIPNMPERILRMAEKQSEHRQFLEKQSLQAPIDQSKRGQLLGFVIAVLFLLATVFLALNGFTVVAGVLGGTTLIGLVAIFVTGKYLHRRNESES